MYCKLHALVEPGLSPPLGRIFECQNKKKEKKKNKTKPSIQYVIQTGDRPMYQHISISAQLERVTSILASFYFC